MSRLSIEASTALCLLQDAGRFGVRQLEAARPAFGGQHAVPRRPQDQVREQIPDLGRIVNHQHRFGRSHGSPILPEDEMPGAPDLNVEPGRSGAPAFTV